MEGEPSSSRGCEAEPDPSGRSRRQTHEGMRRSDWDPFPLRRPVVGSGLSLCSPPNDNPRPVLRRSCP